jgi:predicted transglutaminase-like cysteine proteinase
LDVKIVGAGLAAWLLLTVGGAHAASVTGASKDVFIQQYGPALAPLAFVSFCMRHQADCDAASSSDAGQRSMAELRAINSAVNADIKPVRKPTEPLRAHWSVESGAGDCNDYAVTKRHRLLAAGWHTSRLRLAVTVTQGGVGHLVLVVRMAHGDVVLDNLRDEVTNWADLPYEWVSMQSDANPRFWVAIGDRGRATHQRLQRLAASAS